MTFILDDSNNKVLTGKWIDKNHPENGVFRIYWVEDGNRISDSPEATGDEFKDKGAVAYEINYKDTAVSCRLGLERAKVFGC